MPITKQATRSRPNLRVIPTVTPDKPKKKESVLGSIPAAQVPVQVSIPSLVRYNPEKISDEKNRASQKQKVSISFGDPVLEFSILTYKSVLIF
jgi:hypothetical protein